MTQTSLGATLLMMPANSRPGGWLVSPRWDAFWIQAMFWVLLAVFALRSAFGGKPTVLVLTLLFWIGHRLATTYLAFCVSAYRALVNSQPARFLYVPLGLGAGILIFLFLPQALFPVPVAYRLLFLAGINVAWELWHFTMQHYGVVSIYRTLAGQEASASAKRLEKGLCLWIGMVMAPGALAYHAWRVDSWLVAGAAALLVAAPTAFWCRLELASERGSKPKAYYFAGIALATAASYFSSSFAPFFLVWPLHHWIVALGLTTHMAAGEPAGGGDWYGFWSRFHASSWRLLILLCAASVLLAPVMEFAEAERRPLYVGLIRFADLLSIEKTYRYAPLLIPGFERLLMMKPWVLGLTALGFWMSFLHYLMDRAIFRFSDAQTRRISLGLLLKKPPAPHRA